MSAPQKKLSKISLSASLAAVFRGVSISGLLVVFFESIIIFQGFHQTGLFLFLIVVFGGTLATAIRVSPNLAADTDPQRPRTWRNAIANGGVAAFLAFASLSLADSAFGSVLVTAFVASLAGVFSDTLSHEMGVIFGARPRLITTFEVVRPGENGAISLVGSVVGLIASFGLSGIAFAASFLSLKAACLAALAGCIGNILDSLLGATLERKGWIGNNMVNLCCSLISALIAFGFLSIFI